jgi:hypothetical protein
MNEWMNISKTSDGKFNVPQVNIGKNPEQSLHKV